MQKSNRSYLRKLRYTFQWGVFCLVVYAGYKLYLFIEHFTSGTALIQRPPLVDGFLPIGALMSLKLWIIEGVFDSIHPASLVIFLSALIVSLLLRKSFCGWLCPVGTLSEAVFKAGKRLFGKNYKLSSYIDYPLRSVKYILLGFFLYVAGKMSSTAIEGFLNTFYWKVADIKMLKFFTEMSALTFTVLLGLLVLSLFLKNFWCRYLCPYGALLGILSLLSPLKITRNDEACTHCHLCTKNCPSHLPIEEKQRLKSPECTGCLTCVSVCPSKGALDISLHRKPVNPLIYTALIVVVFFGIISIGKLTGRWHSSLTYEEYKAVIPVISELMHP
ncbi:MAG: 4Fe-4S binding protein [Nitrospirae bacterium]|nr:4Fe-4S binding protein [Nitrospirota bacterium]